MFKKTCAKAKNFVQHKTTQAVATGTALATAAGTASADIATSIGDAFDSATNGVSLAVDGTIALVAIVTGVGLIVSLLRR
jgi:hypothetical protein